MYNAPASTLQRITWPERFFYMVMLLTIIFNHYLERHYIILW